MTTMRITLLAAALALAGCSDREPEPQGAEAATATAPAAPTAIPEQWKDEPAALALMADGLSLLPVGVFQPKVIAFGATRAEVETAAASAFPGVTPERSTNDECGAGPMQFTRFGTLTLNFQDGKFAGWFADSPANIATIDGIQPGVTREELERERPVELVENTTLEGEFSYTLPNDTEIAGFLEGTGGSAVVKSLNAGTDCFFR